MVSYNLQLWFTWATFMWCISMVLQVVVELVPWAIKRLVNILRPQSTEVLRMRLAYYMALRPFVKFLLVSAWNWGSWAFIRGMIALPSGQSVPSYVGVIYSIWECLFFLSLLLFIEKFILQLIVTSFHKKAYGDRITDNDHALKILDRLKKTKRRAPQDFLKRIRRNKQNGNGGAGRSSTSNQGGIPSIRSASQDDGVPQSIMRPDESGNRGNVHFPSQNMDTLIAIPPLEEKDASVITEEDSPHMQEHNQHHNHTQRPYPSTAESRTSSTADFVANLTKRLREVKTSKHDQKPPSVVQSPPPLSRSNTMGDDKSFMSTAGTRPGRLLKAGYKKMWRSSQSMAGGQGAVPHGTSHQAKVLAKRIYHNIVGPTGSRAITEADFYPFFRTHQEAAQAFRLFDEDGNNNISKTELRSACIRIYRERKNLARSMRDLSQATGKLDIILMIVFAVIWIIIVCAAFGVNVGTSLMPLWSAFIAASFVFGNSAKDAFESIIFVFVTHPFDAGDRVYVGTNNWIVARVGLLVSTFINWDGTVVYVKNSVLSTLYITNVRRSGPTGESIEIHASYDTPSWKIYKLREHMQEWVNQHPNLYRPNSSSTNIISFENQNKITMTFYFEHTQNWQDSNARWLRHNHYIMELKEESERLAIDYALPSQPFEGHEKREGPPEIYNMGRKTSGEGTPEGLIMRNTFRYRDEESTLRGPIGPNGSGAPDSGASNNNSGAQAGAAATLAFSLM
ncbi:Mechanosensitive ion channel-domain-containing protein [Dichotomocladium elegans]|nr:Mechanosensitive ion channel-domain-containing protein [Dichotomocladium elegans]